MKDAIETRTPCTVRIGRSGREIHRGEITRWSDKPGRCSTISLCSTHGNRPHVVTFTGNDLSRITCDRCKPKA